MGDGEPVASTLKVAGLGAVTVTSAGGVVILGGPPPPEGSTSSRSRIYTLATLSLKLRPPQSMVALWSAPKTVQVDVLAPPFRYTVGCPAGTQKVRNTSCPATRSKGMGSLVTVLPAGTVTPASQVPPNVTAVWVLSTPFSVRPSRCTKETRCTV